MSFDKPGRPRKDPAKERLRIYAAALPAIRRDGVRARMDVLADSAHMSVGGVYHYFDSKRDLVLHGLNPEALALACHTFDLAIKEAAASGPAQVASTYIDRSVYMFRLIQPAVMAAVDMGIDEIKTQLARVLYQDADGLVHVLATVVPDLDEPTRTELATRVRRTLMALALDTGATEEDVRRELAADLQRFSSVA